MRRIQLDLFRPARTPRVRWPERECKGTVPVWPRQGRRDVNGGKRVGCKTHGGIGCIPSESQLAPGTLIHNQDVDSGDTPRVDPGDATRCYPLDFGDTP